MIGRDVLDALNGRQGELFGVVVVDEFDSQKASSAAVSKWPWPCRVVRGHLLLAGPALDEYAHSTPILTVNGADLMAVLDQRLGLDTLLLTRIQRVLALAPDLGGEDVELGAVGWLAPPLGLQQVSSLSKVSAPSSSSRASR